MKVELSQNAIDDLLAFKSGNQNLVIKVMELIKDILRSPFDGLGKPEPLKHEYQGCWSRRISDEHRLIYQMEENKIIVLSCKGHYA